MDSTQSGDQRREASDDRVPILELESVSKSFGVLEALRDVSIKTYGGEVHCLLGDNGAGKSTLIKVLAGVHRQTSGVMYLDGSETSFANPRQARSQGIATVHQNTGVLPLMSVARNFFIGAEPTKGRGPLRRIDMAMARRVAIEEIHKLGIRHVDDPNQLVGTMSGGERQALAIGRALYFGARVLILDEPTAALGVREAGTVLQAIDKVRDKGVAVLLITHNSYHAMAIGDRFTVLIGGRAVANFEAGEKTQEEVIQLMAGGAELESLGFNVNRNRKSIQGPETST